MAERSKERLYQEKEVAEILQRAAGLHRKQETARPALSLAELESIARDAGIDPSLVRQAARDFERQPRSSGFLAKLLGAPPTFSIDRLVEGELAPEQHEDLAADIRATFGMSMVLGQLSSIGKMFSWTGFNRSSLIEARVTTREGKTVIQIDSDSRQFAGGLFGGFIGGFGGGVGANVGWMVPHFLDVPAVMGFAAAGCVVAAAYGLARVIYTSSVRRLHEKMSQLADTIESRVNERPR
ncbi:hypothetical protein P2318_30855 [Myxococcaceae bacterium GXIMD 01537]